MKKNQTGSSLTETLLAVALLSFLIISGGMSALKSIILHRESCQKTVEYIAIECELAEDY